MNGVIGLTGLLLSTDLDDRQRQYAEGVQSAGEALLAIINDILDFSKIEAGRLELEVIDFDLVQVIEEAAGLVASPAQRKGLELVTSCAASLPSGVRGDPARLRQILLNLASNAVKFTLEGEIVMRALVVDDDGDDVTVRFEVIDTGIGISEADGRRLFEPFSQADASTTRRFGGTGLGLAISRRLAAAMGGELGFDSVAGRGQHVLGHAAAPAPGPRDRSGAGAGGRRVGADRRRQRDQPDGPAGAAGGRRRRGRRRCDRAADAARRCSARPRIPVRHSRRRHAGHGRRGAGPADRRRPGALRHPARPAAHGAGGRRPDALPARRDLPHQARPGLAARRGAAGRSHHARRAGALVGRRPAPRHPGPRPGGGGQRQQPARGRRHPPAARLPRRRGVRRHRGPRRPGPDPVRRHPHGLPDAGDGRVHRHPGDSAGGRPVAGTHPSSP